MDAGFSAVLGALVGALAGPLSQILVQRGARANRQADWAHGLQHRQRDAILEVVGVLTKLSPLSAQSTLPSLSMAVTRLDLLVDTGDEDLVIALRRAITPLLDATPGNYESAMANSAPAIARWSRGAAAWRRHQMSAQQVRRLVLDE